MEKIHFQISMIPFIIFTFLILVFDPCLIASHSGKEMELQVNEIIAKADSLYQIGKIRQALKIYEAVLEMTTNAETSAKVLYNIGEGYKTLGMYNMAIAALDSLLESFPEKVQREKTVFQLGTLHFILKDYEKSRKYLRQYMQEYADSSGVGKVQFQLAYSYQQTGELDAAIETYKTSMENLPILSDYAMYYTAQCYRELGKCDSSYWIFNKIENDYQDNTLNIDIGREIADCFYDNEYYEDAGEKYAKILKQSKLSEDQESEIMYRLGVCHEKTADITEAKRYYVALTEKFPRKNYAYQAMKALETLDVTLTSHRRFLFGKISYYNGYYLTAVEKFRSFVSKYPSHKDADAAQYWVGRSYDRARQRSKAVREYQKLLDKFPHSNLRSQAKKQIAECYRKMGDDDMALISYRQFKKAYPNQKKLVDDSYYEIGRIYERKGDMETAIDTYLYLLNVRNPSHYYRTLASWRVVQVTYKLGQHQESIEAAKEYLKRSDDYYKNAQVSYWIGKNYLAEGDTLSAREIFQQTAEKYHNSYYGKRSKSQIDKKVWNDLRLTEIPAVTEEDLFDEKAEILRAIDLVDSTFDIHDDIHLKKGKLLIELGFFDVGHNELVKVQKKNPGNLRMLLELAYLYTQGRSYYNAAIIARDISKYLEEPLPKGLEKFLFPICYPEYISVQAEKYDLDPLFMCGLIKQESWFNPKATSWAGARGLMQVIPPTAREIASELEVEDFDMQQLYEPELSIRFGTYYIYKQINAFDGKLAPALAAYNGGPGNSRRWLRGTDDIDEFIEGIEFKETRDYVRIVLNNYWKYLELWRDGEKTDTKNSQ